MATTSTIYCILNKKGNVMNWAETENEAKTITEKKAKWGWTYRAITKTTCPAKAWELAGDLSDPSYTDYNGDKLNVE